MLHTIPDAYKEIFEQDNKVGLLATVDPEGYPHVTFINTISAHGDTGLTWGQFCEGMSKKNVLQEPRTGFLVLTFDMELWTGKAVWKSAANTGPEMDRFNQKPLFRYNSYFGIGRVHYMDLVEISETVKLNIAAAGTGAILSKLTKPFARKRTDGRILSLFSERLLNQLMSLSFIAYIGDDGFPVIVPVIQAQAAGSGRIVFSMTPFGRQIRQIPAGVKAAVYCANMGCESVLAKGTYGGVRRGIIPAGIFDVEKVYNSMLPKAGYIYPKPDLCPVTDWT